MSFIFTMYVPGAKGKFITELCDLLLDQEKDVIDFNNTGGNVGWNFKLGSNKYFAEYPNGIFPEEVHYKEYINQIETTAQDLGHVNLCIDTHYVFPETIEYLLERNHKVIRIYTTREDAPALQNNFFYKNFMYDLNHPNMRIEDIIKHSLLCAKSAVETAYRFDEFKDDLNLPIHKWSREKLKELFKAVGHFTNGYMPEFGDRENLLNLRFSELNSMDTLMQLPTFLNLKVNDKFLNRCNSYMKKQSEIQTFDEYVDKFLKANQGF